MRAIHFCKTLCDCEFHVARTIVYIPPPSSLHALTNYWRSRECHNIVYGCFSTWGLTLVPHCTLFVCNSYVMCLCTSPPVHSIPYTVSSSISVTVSAALLAIALCKSDIWLQSGKIGEYPTKHIQGAVSMLSCFLVAHWFVITQANNDKCTCFTMAGCHTVLTPIEKQSGQQVPYACHLLYLSEWVEDIMLSNQYTTCSTTVWFILKRTHEAMRVPSCGGRHGLQWKVVLGNHINSTAHWHALYSYDYEWRITEREHKFNTGAL